MTDEDETDRAGVHEYLREAHREMMRLDDLWGKNFDSDANQKAKDLEDRITLVMLSYPYEVMH